MTSVLRTRIRKLFKRARRRLGGFLLRHVGRHVVGWLSRTWRADVQDQSHFELASAGRGCLVSMWHGRMIVPVELFRDRGIHVLVSPSEDGDLSERMLQDFGYEVVRGSSSRGGAKALRALLAVLDAGGSVVITPDGPRGPMHSVNAGLAWMARATGRPIVPVGMAAGPAWRLKSWDRFTIPKRRARIAITFGEPVSVPREASAEDLEELTRRVRERMLDAERRSYSRLGLEPDL